MPFPREDVDPKTLAPMAAARFEAEVFIENHQQDYFACPTNLRAMLNYMESHNLSLTTEHYERAFRALSAQGKLLQPKEAMAKASYSELQQMAKEHGIPRHDPTTGKFLGFDWPPEWGSTPLPDTSERVGAYTQAAIRPSHPEDLRPGYRPSKREFQQWDSQRMRTYLEHIGAWGRELPSWLR